MLHMFIRSWALLLVLAASVTAEARRTADPMLELAIERAGGEARLAAADRLSWRGTATIHDGGEIVEIGLDTHVRPFGHARSESWLVNKGRETARTMIIEGKRGWIEREGERSAMPAAMLKHERQQFAVYGLMRLLPARGRIVARRATTGGRTLLRVAHPRAPITDLVFAPDGTLIEARNRVADPSGNTAEIDQLFRFSGHVTEDGLSWPRRIEILQRGRLYFTLDIDSFEVSSENSEGRRQPE
jgi:hypothetical protein